MRCCFVVAWGVGHIVCAVAWFGWDWLEPVVSVSVGFGSQWLRLLLRVRRRR
jgi:hypothetical protein